MGGDIPRCVYFCMDVESGQLELKKKNLSSSPWVGVVLGGCCVEADPLK